MGVGSVRKPAMEGAAGAVDAERRPPDQRVSCPRAPAMPAAWRSDQDGGEVAHRFETDPAIGGHGRRVVVVDVEGD